MKGEAKVVGFEALLNVLAEKGANALKEEGMNMVVEAGVDFGASMIPGIGGMYNSYKQKRLQANLKSFNEILLTRIDFLF
ncbi:hypothetical protein BWGOE6_04020 [Bacillus mycoides]|uniref:hypothetical protein n=1 Tax=Bacillus mycoides TaxID=1405 RepID=UPI000872C144|nr:hypothetical protein [Bacillus mycoides]OFD66077.1 hypothetical protein BWGOE6_04020 [Bacillus mycoides]